MSKLKEKVLELAEIARACPDNLQVACFEVLLRDYLDSQSPRRRSDSSAADASRESEPTPSKASEPALEDIGKGQDDLCEADLHVKARHFLRKYSLSLSELNNLFYKENDQILPLYEDLKTTRVAESQVRITLLQCLLHALQSGVYEAEVDTVRTECSARKCYDRNNFGNNFSNNAGLFDFARYNKTIKKIRLSEEGRKELAELVRELQ